MLRLLEGDALQRRVGFLPLREVHAQVFALGPPPVWRRRGC